MRPAIVWVGEMPHKWMKSMIWQQSALFVSIGTSGSVYPAAVRNDVQNMRKSTVELNLEPSHNQDQFDLAIHKPASVAVEEFSKPVKIIIQIIKKIQT